MKEQEKIHHMLQSRDEANEIKYFNRHAESSKKIFKDLKKYIYISEEKFGPELSKS